MSFEFWGALYAHVHTYTKECDFVFLAGRTGSIMCETQCK